jgi:hypothetical protein
MAFSITPKKKTHTEPPLCAEIESPAPKNAYGGTSTAKSGTGLPANSIAQKAEKSTFRRKKIQEIQKKTVWNAKK